MAKNPQRWKFHRVGGLEQVSLATSTDLANLGKLDQKLWTALSCPTRGLELDPKTLDLLDGDGDGRVRAPDVVAALEWCKPRLAHLERSRRRRPRGARCSGRRGGCSRRSASPTRPRSAPPTWPT
jgi:hypothetical protein